MKANPQARFPAVRKAGYPLAPSWAEVDLAGVRHNVRAVKELVGRRCGVWAVVKANAYGHGLPARPGVEVARAAVEGGAVARSPAGDRHVPRPEGRDGGSKSLASGPEGLATGLAVASFGEGAALRRAGIEHPILVLCAGDPKRARETVRLDLIQTMCNMELARALSHASQALGKPARVHLKVDTGMGRLGVRPEEAVGFARAMLDLPGMALEGVFSHLADAEGEDPAYARLQWQRFMQVTEMLKAAGIEPGLRHLANSAATLRFPEMRLDGVRPGLLIYGIVPDAPGLAPVDLRQALTWKTRLAFVRRLPAGTRVSYGGTYVAGRETAAGVLPLGYADGYPRHASNRGYVLVRGKRCPVLGRVCMDHTVVGLGGVEDARAGEEVVLVGRQGEEVITANDVARWAGGVAHEVTTLIGERVVRIFKDG